MGTQGGMEDGQGYRCALGMRGPPTCVTPQQYEAEEMLALSVPQTVSVGCQTSQVGYTPKVIVVSALEQAPALWRFQRSSVL